MIEADSNPSRISWADRPWVYAQRTERMLPEPPVAIDGGRPKNFLRPCLLLLLQESPAHGYDLLERLRQFGIERDAGGLYRTLRALEHEGLVSSSWEASFTGPDRRTYELTALGARRLESWATALRETHLVLSGFLERHEGAQAILEGS